MNRKKSSGFVRQSDQSLTASRELPLRKLSAFDRENRPLDRQVTLSTELSRKSSLSSKSELKELEQLEKQAIRHFYDKQCQIAFETLRSCERMAAKLQSTEHRVYLCYLQAEFSYKMGEYDRSAEFYRRSKQIECGTELQRKLAGYFDSLEALHLGVLFERKEYLQLVIACDPLTDRLELGSRLWFQSKYYKIKAQLEIGKEQQARSTALDVVRQVAPTTEHQKYILKVVQFFERKLMPETAIEVLEGMIKHGPVGPNASEGYSRLAHLHLEVKNTVGAIYGFEMLLRYRQLASDDQDSNQSRVQLARLYSDIGNYDRALQIIQGSIGISAEGRELEADCLAKSNRKGEAVAIYRRLLQEQQQLIRCLSLRIKLLAAFQCSEQIQAEQARLLADAQQAATGDSVISLTEYANYLRKQAHFEPAEDFYKEAAALADSLGLPEYNFIILSNLGEMLEELDRRSESLAYYRAALRLNIRHELAETVKKRVQCLLLS